jgi:hypothetical protein
MRVIDRLVGTLEALAKGKNIAIAGALYATFAMILTVGGAKIENVAGSGSILDLRHHFTEDEAFAVLSRYGDEERRLYVRLEIVDFLNPLAYGALFALVLAYLLPRAFSATSPMRRLALLPALAVLMDFLENAGLMTMAATYPERWPRLGTAAGLFNAAKWSLVATCIGLAATGLLGWVVQTLRRRREA